ncbi:glycosyltransferase family 2 protein [Schaedlerella sp.]|jgi:glycosyltransferase involved in cell wall biosynthesis|uniref:glycosyltransferase family 2 protein n=1 Tax=Schaedlerella sp. TaxID=2676057 RepID=UPI0037473822|nr:glycosyltransferase family 2 protein [Ruminococcus sp.]MCI9328331.1 glycosyltransferase family 2 protein [Ruminococcus sp.]
MFTFVVTCYNQAEVVTHALESIRYQICRFGKDQKFQLIVADDGSEDSSCEVIEQWITGNRDIFERVDKLFREKNAGICKNYAEALRIVKGDRFVVLNGDDLFSPYNLFGVTDLLDEYDIVCTAFIKFTGSGDMIRTYATYLDVVLQNFIRGGILRRSIKLGCAVMGTAVYRKELLTEEVFDFILRFRTVNDRACFQKIVDDHEELRVCYVNRPFILYRISENSISNFNSPNRRLHNQEVAQLCREERTSEQSVFFRVMLYLQEKSAAVRANPNYFVRLMRFFSPYYFIMLWLFLKNYREIVRMEHELIDPFWKHCSDFSSKIKKRAEKSACCGKNKDHL